ncbi:MAG: autotransporter domain-containing protein [Parvibaculum sp.]|nr:autotransporter domain-containing protein [Parvibaculum sp.]
MTFVSSNGRRNLRRSLLASSVLSTVLLAHTGAAFAGDLSVSTALTDPISTSVGDGGGAGDIDILTSGSVTLDPTDVGAAVTLDSPTESITNSGSITAGQGTIAENLGQNGIRVTTATTGGVSNIGTIKTGTTQTTDSNGAIVITGVGADAAVLIEADLGTGFNNTGTISSIASSTNPYAVLIQSVGAPITFGVIDAGDAALNYGIHNKGTIYGIGYINGNSTTAMGFVGSIANPISIPGINNETGGTIQATSADDDATAIDIGAFTSITGPGIVNGGTITASIASPNNAGVATAIHIGANGSVTEIANSGTIQGASSGAAGGDAFAIDVDALGSLTTITNNASSSIFATASNAGDDATAIRDQSGTLAMIANAGSISGATTATGTAVAIDLSAGAGNTIINNTGNIVGQINWGAGNYQLNASDGVIISDFSINAGAAVINLTGDASLTAGSTLLGGGTLDLNAATGTTLSANANNFNVTNITFDSGSTYAVSYDTATATPSGHIAADTATLHDGAIINVTLTSYLGAATPTITVVETNTALNFDTPADPSGLVIGGIGAGYNAVLATANANADLTVTLSRKTAAQLGLVGNAAVIYDASVDALEADTTFGAAVGNLGTVAGVVSLYNQLLPDLSSAREQQAMRMQDVASGFVNDRLNLMRTAEQGAGDGGGRYNKRYRRAGLWLQEAASFEKGDGDVGTQAYDGELIALALGYDARDDDGDVWGGSLTYASMSYDAGLSEEDNVASTTMAQVYHSLNRGAFFWDTMGSVAWNSYESNRTVTAGAVARTASADWTGYQGGLSSQVGVAGRLGFLTFRPSAGLSYTYLSQDGYSEEGGGTGVNLKVDSSTFSSLRGNVELRVSGIFSKEPQIVPYIRGGISQELMDTKTETSGSFVSTGTTFTLQNTELDKSAPFVGAGVSVVGGYSRLSFEYTGQLGSKFTSHQGVATVSFMF